ncbi:uncharacterized protein JCM6883_006713 [Sporobolomyces salmoneus]|uniref:uncharacterized protein n=1 Tax=Sporobolomyces salmoneus TaxID=183962 RepID=UPI003178D74A
MTTARPPPHAALTTLLPLLFSSDDSIPLLPPSLLSKPTLQAHHYLSLTTSDDRYWTCGTKDSQVVLARREIVESGSIEEIELGEAQYSYDLEGELKALIPVSLPSPSSSSSSSSTPILDVILLHEEPEPSATSSSSVDGTQEEAGWKFLRLSAPSIVLDSPDNGFNALVKGGNSSNSGRKSHLKPEDWFTTVEAAIESIQTKSKTSVQNRPNHLDFAPPQGGAPAEEEEDEYDEYGTRRRKDTSSNRMKSREEMAEGEGTTPGAYGDSNDFWAGWSDSEGEDGGEGGHDSGVGFVNDTRGKDTEKENEDEDYWNAYGGVTNQVDDGRQQQGTATAEEEKKVEPMQVKTRSRRSSTVTPFKLSSTASIPSSPPPAPQPQTSHLSADPTAASFLSFDSPAQPTSSLPLPNQPSSLPPLASAVKLASITQSSVSDVASSAVNTESATGGKEDENLRFALAGIWGMYQGPREGREERMKRFERIVREVLRS